MFDVLKKQKTDVFRLGTIHRERQNAMQWHYESKKVKGKADNIYLIYDPEDYTIANQILLFLKEKKFRVNLMFVIDSHNELVS